MRYPHYSIGLAGILSGGALVSSKKVDDLFLVVALKQRSVATKYTSKYTHRAKSVLKLTLALPGGLHLVCWGCTYKISL